MGKTNSIAKAIDVLAIISAICGVFAAIGAGFVFGETIEYGYYYTHEKLEYNWTAFFTVLLVTPIEVIFLLGFSEIVELLHRTYLHTKNFDENFYEYMNIGEENEVKKASKSETEIVNRPPSSPDDEHPWELEEDEQD